MTSSLHSQSARYDELFDFVRYLVDIARIPTAATMRAYVDVVRAHVRTSEGTELQWTPLCQAWFRRAMATPVEQRHKDPASKDLVSAIIEDESEPLCVRAAISFQWSTLLRMGQLASKRVWQFDPDFDVLRSDVQYDQAGNFLRLIVKRGKVDHFNRGGARFLLGAPSGSSFCPLKFFLKYFNSTTQFPSDQPLFRHPDGRNVTLSHTSKCIKRHALRLGLNPELYASHSIRIGGATALRAEGFSLQEIMLHGGWTSEQGCLRYLQLTAGTAQRFSEALQLSVRMPQVISPAALVPGRFSLSAQPLRSAQWSESVAEVTLLDIQRQHASDNLTLVNAELLAIGNHHDGAISSLQRHSVLPTRARLGYGGKGGQ